MRSGEGVRNGRAVGGIDARKSGEFLLRKAGPASDSSQPFAERRASGRWAKADQLNDAGQEAGAAGLVRFSSRFVTGAVVDHGLPGGLAPVQPTV